MYKISFIVPVYNTAPYLYRCIGSILGQTYQNYELILINDGSTDNSLEICQEYAGKNNVIIITQPNAGVSAARNAGLRMATGDYYFFVDSDDWIEEQSLEHISKYLNDNDVDVLRIGCQVVRNGSAMSESLSKTGKITTDVLMKRNYFCPALWGYLFKASLVRENKIAFIQSLKYSEDSNFIFKCLSKSKCIYLLDEQVYNYNVRENSAIRQNFTIEWAEANLVALIDLLRFQSGTSTAFQKKAVHYYMEAYFSMLFRVGNYNHKHVYNNYQTFCCEMNTYLRNSSLLRNPSIVSFEVLKLIYSSVFFSYRLKVRLASLYKRKVIK